MTAYSTKSLRRVKKGNRIRLSPGDRVFTVCIYAVLILLSLIFLYPILYVLSASFSSPRAVEAGQLVLLPIEPSLDGFEISARAGKISLRARDLSTLSAALGDYLRTVAGIDLAWLGDGLDRLPAVLPRPEGTIARAVPQKYRSAFNYCTFSYTMVWWDWARWERELDHMALSGVNLPLMTVGLEGVWYDTLLEFGLSDEEARSFLCGPAFLAWQWLTNIESFCGPLPKSWIDDHVALGRRIIARMRELGMTPIMQGPSGLCPRLFKEKFPDANIRFKPEWNNIGFTAEIDPLDPLFARLGETFLECSVGHNA